MTGLNAAGYSVPSPFCFFAVLAPWRESFPAFRLRSFAPLAPFALMPPAVFPLPNQAQSTKNQAPCAQRNSPSTSGLFLLSCVSRVPACFSDPAAGTAAAYIKSAPRLCWSGLQSRAGCHDRPQRGRLQKTPCPDQAAPSSLRALGALARIFPRLSLAFFCASRAVCVNAPGCFPFPNQAPCAQRNSPSTSGLFLLSCVSCVPACFF